MVPAPRTGSVKKGAGQPEPDRGRNNHESTGLGGDNFNDPLGFTVLPTFVVVRSAPRIGVQRMHDRHVHFDKMPRFHTGAPHPPALVAALSGDIAGVECGGTDRRRRFHDALRDPRQQNGPPGRFYSCTAGRAG